MSVEFKLVQNSVATAFEEEVQYFLDKGYALLKDPEFHSTPNGEYVGKYIAFLTR